MQRRLTETTSSNEIPPFDSFTDRRKDLNRQICKKKKAAPKTPFRPDSSPEWSSVSSTQASIPRLERVFAHFSELKIENVRDPMARRSRGRRGSEPNQEEGERGRRCERWEGREPRSNLEKPVARFRSEKK